MFFIKEKLARRIDALHDYRYLDRRPLEEFVIFEDVSKNEKYPPSTIAEGEKITAGDIILGRDNYFWIIGDVFVPENNQGDFTLLFNLGKYVPGNTSGFEALCFINKDLYQAVDGNHNEVFIDSKYNGQTIQVALKLWTGLEGGGPHQKIEHRVYYMDQAYLNPVVDDLFYTAKNILDTIVLLDDHDPVKFKLTNLLDDTFLKVNWPTTVEESISDTFKEAQTYLAAGLESFEKKSEVHVTAIGHTHIDVAWLWRLKHTREKAVRSFSTVLRLMEQYPEYVFLQTQPQIYEYIKEDYPELYAKIKAKISEGRWEVDGGMWLESDTNLPSGESLVRQFLVGYNFMKQEFDKEPEYLWLPDVFGYSWALPQILKKSGIEVFMTTKISWNQFNRMPHDTFVWRGIDGSEVLTHFITTPDPNFAEGPFFYTYNGLIEPYTVKGIYDGYRDKHITDDLLLAYGYGDGGGGVNRDMLENIRRIDKTPGLPNISPGTAGKYFKKLKTTFDQTPYYKHTWDGELYLEYHRGTYTSQARTKWWNRFLEHKYKMTEFLSIFRMLTSEHPYPNELLNKGWKIILRNQFHDIIPGSSIREVYEDSELEYTEADEIANSILNSNNEKEEKKALINDSSWLRTSMIEVSDYVSYDAQSIMIDDRSFKITESLSKKYIVADGIAGLSINQINQSANEASIANDATNIKITSTNSGEIETPFYKIKYNQKGWLTSIYDKENQREVISNNSFGNQLILYEDKPLNWDAWDIDIFHLEKFDILAANEIKVVESNELFIKIKFTYEFRQSIIEQFMILYSHTRRIDFETNANWNERQQLLKCSFEVAIRSSEARYDIQFGNVTRPTHWNTSWDYARFESVGHQWADLSETNYGVALLNDCKYGYSIKDNRIQLSLLKGGIYPDPDADIGTFKFTYSLLPHDGDYIKGNVIAEAYDLNAPMKMMRVENTTFGQLFNVDSTSIVSVDSVKLAEDGSGIILRLHECVGATQKVEVSPSFNYRNWEETNLMEETFNKSNGLAIKFTIKPYEIITLKIII